MDRLDAMRVVLAVADRRSFAEAARALRLSPAAATRAVAMIEDELGLPLFHRTTRSVRLTERGNLYVEHCRRILAEIETARRLVRGEDATPRGNLSITAPVLFGRLHIMPVAEALADRHPDLAIRLVFVDRVTHLIEESFDLAVRIGELADSTLIGLPIASVRRVVVASRAYLATHGHPTMPADLKSHRIIAFEGVGATNEWRFGGRDRRAVTVTPHLSVNSADAAIGAAIRGRGITRALSYQVSEAVADGRLTRLLQEDEPDDIAVSLVFQAQQRGSPNVAAFVRAAKAYFATPRW